MPTKLPETLKFSFTYVMSFGKWLKENRKAEGLSQDRLADLVTSLGHPVTGAYVSMIEREYDRNKKGEPTRINEDLVEFFAKALNRNIDDARIAANYAPRSAKLQPTNSTELMTALKRLGIEVDHIEPFNLSPDDYAKLLDDIRLVIELRARR